MLSNPVSSLLSPRAPVQRDPVHLDAQPPEPTSNAGQLRGCTSLGASISMATETPIFTNSHDMKLTALTPGDMLESRLVMPRAINAARHHHHGRAVQRRPRDLRFAGEKPRQRGNHHTDSGLHRDHPPRRDRRILRPQGLRLYSRQWLGRRLVDLVVPPTMIETLGHGEFRGRVKQSRGIIRANPYAFGAPIRSVLQPSGRARRAPPRRQCGALIRRT